MIFYKKEALDLLEKAETTEQRIFILNLIEAGLFDDHFFNSYYDHGNGD